MSRNDPRGLESTPPHDESDQLFRVDFEPPSQGGGRYLICIECGRETIRDTRPETIDHQRGCALND